MQRWAYLALPLENSPTTVLFLNLKDHSCLFFTILIAVVTILFGNNFYRMKASLLCCLVLSASTFGQVVPNDWHHLKTQGAYPGISSTEAYELLENMKSQTVVVAVIDSGVDHEHEDLREVMWVNKDEIPNNHIDDDGNGYVDDIHGWSFLGNPNGENIVAETLEETRIYASGKRFPGKRETFLKALETFHTGRVDALENFWKNTMFLRDILEIENEFKGTTITSKTLEGLQVREELQNSMKSVLNYVKGQGGQIDDLSDLKSGIQSNIDFYRIAKDYYYNPEFDGRRIVKDNYLDQNEKSYGNNDSKGPDSSHGTHVAGIIGAKRSNAIGMDGIANNVRIMSLRVVPNGDERDKDVANAIYYAVDNGAKVINMSFGKAFSWNKKIVDDAVRYATRKDVLLVHASGNSALQLNGSNNFPNILFEKKGLFGPKNAKNWLEVGAVTYYRNENLVATFSNYGKDLVDLFAPGYQIYSTVPANNYQKYNGTSMAAPMVSGVAALLRSYFPKLSAKEVKEIILDTATPLQIQVKRPNDEKMVAFNELSTTGAVLNAAAAIELALSQSK